MSNRLTFSLASLIVLIAFGLVFGTTSVMAHDASSQHPDQTGLVNVGSNGAAGEHTHSNADGSQDAIEDDPTTTGVTETVPAHNSHPMVQSIVLKDGDTVRGSMVVVTADDAATTTVNENRFTLVVTFDQDVVSGAAFRTVASDVVDPNADPVVANAVLAGATAASLSADVATLGEFMVSVLNGDSTSAHTDTRIAIDSTTITRVAGRSDQFEIVVELTDNAAGTNAFPSGNTGADTRIFKIRVDANAAYSLETLPTGSLTPVTGSGSQESDVYAFTLVNALEALPTAPAAPAGLDTMTTVDHQAGTVSLMWTTVTGAMYEYSSDGGTTWMDATSPQEVTGLTANTDVTLMVRVKATATVPAGMSASVTVRIDTMAPTVEIGAPVLQTDGTVDFHITVSEMLGSGANDLEVDDFTINGDVAAMRELSGPDGDNDFDLTVTPAANMSVIVTLTGDVRDEAGNRVDVTTTPITATYDVMAPILVSSSFAATNATQLTVTLVFNEDVVAASIDIDDARGNGVSQAGHATAVAGADHTYTVLVNAPGHASRRYTYMSLEEGLRDAIGNVTEADIELTYDRGAPTPPTTPMVVIGGPASLSCNPDTPNLITFTITGTTETLVAGDITIGAGWKVGTDNDPADGNIHVIPNGDGSEIGITSLKIDVKAGAVAMGTASNAAATKTFAVGPVLTIPAQSYIVVIRTGALSHLHDVNALYLGSLGVSGQDVNIQEWDCMPDLTVFFGRSGAGSGGGAISVKQSHAHTGDAIGKGTVGVSEIMWGSDEGTAHGLTSNVDQTREQWIELHNTNNRTVTVTLFARPATTVIGGERAPVRADNAEIDRMSNFNIGGAWDVKGQSGDSARGKDFVSMYRSKNGNPYSHGDNNGRAAGKWHVSSLIYKTDASELAGRGATNAVYNYKGTPGRSNTISAVGPVVKTNVPNSPVIFNEVANLRDQTLEWIELKNVSTAARDLRNWEIGLITAKGTEHRFFHFNYGDNHVIIQPGEVLLLVDTDPRYNDDHPVAVGYNVRGGNDQALGLPDDAPRYLVTNFREGGLPDNGEFILTLRTSKGDEGYENKKGTQDRVSDAIGYHSNLVDQGPPNYTNLWPFKVYGHPNKGRNKMEVETVHYRRNAGADPDQGDNNKAEQIALNNAGYTGVGYKRFASRHNPAHGGTPGYDHNGLVKQLTPDVGGGGVVTISEIMLDQGDSRYPQWIELYNSSDSPVNLHAGDHGWRLHIENYDDGEIPINRLNGTLNFRSSDVQTILPKQTVIVASTRARSSGSAFFDTSVIFPPTRVFSVWDDARGALDMKRTTDPILSTEGFYIELVDGKNNVSDSVGNLIDSPNRRVAAEIAWPLSDITGEMMEDAPRSSILRRYREPKGGDSRNWVPYTSAELMDMGILAEGWVLASKTDFREVRQTWYGHGDDIGSPGITGGRVLPVELSRFRPERLDDGSVAIRWITESEKDNAGFNILRSEDRHGEFTKINTQLIAGQGTTSERNAYEFVDKTAKPNVVYYYQIQDVSLDGDIEVLQITHLRGHVSAAGKAATTWGDIKALQ